MVPVVSCWIPMATHLQRGSDCIVQATGVCPAATWSAAEIAWAVRRDSPELLAAVNDFLMENRKGTLFGNITFKKYFGNPKRFSKYSGTDLIFPKYRIGSHINRRIGIQNQSFKYDIVLLRPKRNPTSLYFTKL